MKRVTITLLLAFHILLVNGQNKPIPSGKWEEKFFAAPEIVLPMLIDATIKNSSDYNRLELSKQIANEELKMNRNTILNNISLGSAYSYGTFLNFMNGEQTSSSFNAFSQPSRALYNVGLNLRLPLGEVVNRKHELSIRKFQLQQAEAEQKSGEKEIRREVIAAYQELSLAKIEWEQAQDMLTTAKLNKTISDRRFKSGELQVNDQMAAMELYNKTVLAQEQAKNKYVSAVLLLEEMIGMSIQDLMNAKQ